MADCPAVHDRALRMSYRIGRGEQGVLTFQPYKGHLLPAWRFRTEAVARESAASLWREFERYYEADDFVGMDMARKFLQMGMTRAKRYANHAGGRKYARQEGDSGEGDTRTETGADSKGADTRTGTGVDGKGAHTRTETGADSKTGNTKGRGERGDRGPELPRSHDHADRDEKVRASLVFRRAWERCRQHEGYQRAKAAFQAEQKLWDKGERGGHDGDDDGASSRSKTMTTRKTTTTKPKPKTKTETKTETKTRTEREMATKTRSRTRSQTKRESHKAGGDDDDASDDGSS